MQTKDIVVGCNIIREHLDIVQGNGDISDEEYIQALAVLEIAIHWGIERDWREVIKAREAVSEHLKG